MVYEGRYRGMADSASYADCGQRVAAQRHPLGAGERARCRLGILRRRRHSAKIERKYSENLTGQAGQTAFEIGISRAGPGRRRVRLESHRSGRVWARDLKYHPLGRARAGPGAVGPARLDPTSESWPHPQKPLDLNIGFFTINLRISRNETYQLFSLGM